MKYKFVISLLIGVGLATGIFAYQASAGPLSGAQNNLQKAIGPTELSSNLTDTIATIIKAVLALVGTIFFVLTIYAGILWMTAQGNGEQIEKATGIVKGAIIGLAITMSAYAITAFVTGKLNSDPAGGSSGLPAGGVGNSVCATMGKGDGSCVTVAGDCNKGSVDSSEATECKSQNKVCCFTSK